MKKGMGLVLLVIVFAIAGMPVLNGMIMEKRVRQVFEDIHQEARVTGSRPLFEILGYDRHLFSSEIEWKMVSKALENIGGIHEVVFLDRARHGITKVSTSTSLEKNPWFPDLVNGKLNGKNPLTIKTEINFWGHMKSRVALDAVSFMDGSQTVDVKPGQAILSMDWKKDRRVTEINFAGMDIPGKIKLDGFSWQSDLERVSGNIRAGRASFFLEEFQSSGPGKTTVSKAAFDYELLYHPEKASVSIKTQGRLDSFQSGADEIKNIVAAFHIRQMDAGGYEDLMGFLQEGLMDIITSGPLILQDAHTVRRAMERQAADKGFEWVGICGKLLKQGLEIEVSGLRARMPEGDMEADARIRFENDLPLAGVLSLMMDPSKVLSYLSLKSRIRLPKILDPAGRMLLSPLYPGMPTGLFLLEKDHLVHGAETREGKLFLNQKEVLFN